MGSFLYVCFLHVRVCICLCIYFVWFVFVCFVMYAFNYVCSFVRYVFVVFIICLWFFSYVGVYFGSPFYLVGSSFIYVLRSSFL